MTALLSEAERVARGLTKAQREWLLAAEPTLEPVAKTPCAEWWDNPGRLYVTIGGVEHWLGSKNMTSPAGESQFIAGEERLSPLGVAVRAYLLERRP